ncbi:mechanosensitive ion channel family protein [Acidobacteriota bacterium]
MLNTLKDAVTGTTGFGRIVIIILMALAIHVIVIRIRNLGSRLTEMKRQTSFSKAKTITSLLTSAIIFVIYFVGIGFILVEMGVNVKTYLASASIIGLAIGFGSQGLVQDVVTGLTVIFSDLFHIGEMVEIAGQTGIVKKVGVRFTVIENSFGAEVFIPNRTIANVINYPRGYVRILADITLSSEAGLARQMEERISIIVAEISERLPGILIASPSIEGRQKLTSGKEFLRVKFRVWPSRGAPIETAFKEEIIQSLKVMDTNYRDWMVSVNYEVEKKPISVNFKKRKKAG